MLPRSAQAAFTLIEVMLAIVFFAVTTVAAMELFRSSQASIAEGESVLIATHLAQQRLEELRNAPYASLASEAKAAVAVPAGFSRFSRAVAVTTPSTNLKHIVVTVSWTVPGPGGETSVNLQTYRSNV